jgi:hypothetical protein
MSPTSQMKDSAFHLCIAAAALTRLMSPSKVLPAVQEAFRAVNGLR